MARNTSILSKLNKVNFDRSKLTIKNWQNALYMAESKTHPNRIYLYKIYRELYDDDSLTDTLNLLKDKIKQHNFTLTSNKDTELFSREWFHNFIDYFVDSDFWGHSLLEIPKIEDGEFDINLIPRENIIPERSEYKASYYDTAGIKYDAITSPYLLEVNGINNIGLLNKLAPIILYKKMSIMYWADFQERHGSPLFIIKTNNNDINHRQKITEWHETLGSNGMAIVDPTDEIIPTQVNTTDAFNVYLEMMKWCEAQIQKFVLGGTELMDGASGGSEARAKVHSEQFEVKLRSMMKRIEFYVNKVIIPKFQELGLLVSKKATFSFNNNVDLDEQADLHLKVSKLLSEGQISKEYIAKFYNVELNEEEMEETKDVESNL